MISGMNGEIASFDDADFVDFKRDSVANFMTEHELSAALIDPEHEPPYVDEGISFTGEDGEEVVRILAGGGVTLNQTDAERSVMVQTDDSLRGLVLPMRLIIAKLHAEGSTLKDDERIDKLLIL